MNIFESHIPNEKVKFNEPLKNHTFIQIGGKADILVHPTTVEEITKVVEIANSHHAADRYW